MSTLLFIKCHRRSTWPWVLPFRALLTPRPASAAVSQTMPSPQGNNISTASVTGAPMRPSQPTTLCPRCKRGKHWANTCRSKTDNLGNPLPPLQGNGLRGQPRAPKSITFVQASGPSQLVATLLPHNPFHPPSSPQSAYTEQPQAAQ